MGVHPTHSVWEGREYQAPRHHEVALMCDDIADPNRPRPKGRKFSTPIDDEGNGLVTMMDVPGTDPIMLYEPKHRTA